MRVVLDTNTLASGVLAFTGSPAAAILDAWRVTAFVLVVSEDIVAELENTLAKPYFARRLAPQDTAAFLDLLVTSATIVAVEGALSGVATHPEDDRILECAVTAGAAYLVTGDKKLQQLRAFHGVQIVSPRAFLEVLGSTAG
jgi:uncharacterized protein